MILEGNETVLFRRRSESRMKSMVKEFLQKGLIDPVTGVHPYTKVRWCGKITTPRN